MKVRSECTWYAALGDKVWTILLILLQITSTDLIVVVIKMVVKAKATRYVHNHSLPNQLTFILEEGPGRNFVSPNELGIHLHYEAFGNYNVYT